MMEELKIKVHCKKLLVSKCLFEKLCCTFLFQFRKLAKLKGDLLKLLVLILDICASFVLTVIALSKHKKESGSDVTGEAIASVVVVGVVGIVYIVIIAGYYMYIYILCSRENKCSEILREHGQGMLIAIGGLCFYFGDNLPPLFRNYEGVIGITQGWVEGIQVAGIVALGAATVTYLPVLIDDALKNKESKKEMPMHTTEEATELIPKTETVQKEKKTEEDKTPAHVVVLLLLAKATNLDHVYTAIERAASNKCNASVIGGAWTYYAIYFIAFFVVCLITNADQ